MDDSICVVCQNPFDEETPTATTPCNHVLHSSCFLSAALADDRCPVCRENLYPNEEAQVEVDILSTLGGVLQGEMSRLTNSRSRRVGEEVHIIEINESPNLRRSRLTYSIFKACKEGNLEEVRRLISQDEDLTRAEGDSLDTLLHQAIYADSEPLIRFLINEAGVPVNSTNCFRMTPLHYSMSFGITTPTLLLNCGAYVDAQDSAGKTPLMSACSYNNSEVVRFLLDRGASTRVFDSSGDTCMHHAARGKCLLVLRILLRQTSQDPTPPTSLTRHPSTSHALPEATRP